MSEVPSFVPRRESVAFFIGFPSNARAYYDDGTWVHLNEKEEVTSAGRWRWDPKSEMLLLSDDAFEHFEWAAGRRAQDAYKAWIARLTVTD